MRKVEFKLNKKNKNAGLIGLSLVNNPAFETNFCLMSEDKEQPIFYFSSDEKMIATGALMIPNKMVYRSSSHMKDNKEAYVYFSEETVRESAYLFFQSDFINRITLEHSKEASNNDISLLELWLIEDPNCDKSKALGFDFPKNTLMCSVKFNNPELWNETKTGKFNGFSLEGLFDFNKEDITTLSEDKPNKLELIEKIMTIIKDEFSEKK